jgi:hypothetical protein
MRSSLLWRGHVRGFARNQCAAVMVAAVIGLLGSTSVAIAQVVEMNSRDAPPESARPAVKQHSVAKLSAVPKYSLPPLPPPTSAELFVRKLGAANVESFSFGREPMQVGVDGRIEVPANVSEIRVELASAGALHLRSAWRFGDDEDYTVTVFKGGDISRPLVNRTGSSMDGDRRLIWTAITTGEQQEVLISRQREATGAWTISLERIAHFDQPIQPLSHSVMPKALGDSAFCQRDIACALDVLPDAYDAILLAASRGVAFMFMTTATGNTSTCTGTLLNSAAFPLPLFLTANHCTETAVTLDTFWFFSRAGCGFGTVSPATQVTGGATFISTSRQFDTALLVLDQLPPPAASYTGWNAASITTTTAMLAVHHPRGDVKKASLGNVIGINPGPVPIEGFVYAPNSMYLIDWQVGIVEPGSSGSAFFTENATNTALQVRGTLTGGNNSCSGGFSRTFYQRFDVLYSFIGDALNTPLPPPISTQTVVEYYHASFGHYFITAASSEISALDAGAFAGWARTGQTFKVFPLNAGGASNVCRFFSTSFAPKSSHFYTPFASECNTVKQNRDWQFEGEVLAMKAPDVSGNCPAGTVPLYRLYNNGRGGAPNHRYTTSTTIRGQMVSQGFIPEGYGVLGVIGCVPQ